MAAGDTTVDTVGEFGVRSMFPPDPSGIWLDRRLSGPHSPFLPPVVGTAANSPTVSTVVLGQGERRPGVSEGLARRVLRPAHTTGRTRPPGARRHRRRR